MVQRATEIRDRGLQKMRRCWIAFAAFAILAGTDARPIAAAEPEIHYAPVENLEHIDLALIRSAKKSVDIAMYTLTDWAIIAALKDAHGRGVHYSHCTRSKCAPSI